MISGLGRNLATALPEMAAQRPDTAAVICVSGNGARRHRYPTLTFAQLEEESATLSRGLVAAGIGRGMRTVLMVTPGLEFFALTFALFRAGAVPVLVDPGMGTRNLGRCLAEAEPEAFIGVPRAHAARVALRWAASTLRHHVTVGRRLLWGGLNYEELRKLGRERNAAADTHQDTAAELGAVGPDEVAAILFTSGSTGPPKGVVYTHPVFQAQIDSLRNDFGIEPGEVHLATFPPFALFGPALGMTAVIPDMDATRPGRVTPEHITGPIEHLGITSMFASPALIDRIGRHVQKRGLRLPGLRRVLSAGAPMPPAVLERFVPALNEGVEVHTPYGATEALPVTRIGSDEILGETAAATAAGRGVCVGRPVTGVEVRVIGIDDDAIEEWNDDLELPTGEIGEIVVRGPTVTREYYQHPEATRLAKIRDPGGDGGGVRHRMGDLGYKDEQGRLWFCGRKSQRVAGGGTTYFTIPCEGVFNAHPDVRRTALVRVERAGAPSPALCVELEPLGRRRPQQEIFAELLALGREHPHTRDITEIRFHGEFPVDIRHNAKIFREQLARWAQGRHR